MDKIYIFGHKNPDTDSVTSAIGLSYLKNKLGFKTIPCLLGTMNNETKFVLDYFNVPTPTYLNDTKLQIKDIGYKKNCKIYYKDTLLNLYNKMQENDVTGMPIYNDQNYYYGLVTMKDLLRIIINPEYITVNTSLDNIKETLECTYVTKFDKEINGNIIISAYNSTEFEEKVKINDKSILIVGRRQNIARYAIESHAKLLIIVGNEKLDDDLIEKAKKNKVNILYTKLDSIHATKLLALSNYIKAIVTNEDKKKIVVEENAYLGDFQTIFNKYKYTNYPVVSKTKKVIGLLCMSDIYERKPKKVMLVDHNEYSQSVLGIEEAEIMEIIDHHKVGNINSSYPINIRNMVVGSTSTIVTIMMRECNVKPTKDIAGLLLAGIISDTLLFRSPTTTDIDKEQANYLSKISQVNPVKFSKEMFRAAADIKGKTIEEIFYGDFKSFYINDKKIGIAQVMTIDYEKLLERQDEYIEFIEETSVNENFNILALCITDIINSNSYLLFNQKSKQIFESIYNVDMEQCHKLKGVVSRKKQIIPLLMDELNK